MNLATAIVAGTFLYHGPYFVGSNGRALCDQSLQQTLRRMQQTNLRAVTGSCAPVQQFSGPNIGFEVQILVAGSSGNLRRYDYDSSSACPLIRERLISGATDASVPWVGAFCDDRGLHFDVAGRLDSRINWDLGFGTFETQSACESQVTSMRDLLKPKEQNLFFADCEAIQDVNQRLKYRLRFLTQGPQEITLGIYDELPYDSPTACEVGAVAVDADLDTNHLSTGIHHCEPVRGGMIARHLVLDSYPSRISREEAPTYRTETLCEEAYPAVWEYLQSERHIPFTHRCMAINESYRLFIDYLRARPVVASTPAESLPRPR